jgi:hypothetical protein
MGRFAMKKLRKRQLLNFSAASSGLILKFQEGVRIRQITLAVQLIGGLER